MSPHDRETAQASAFKVRY